MSKTSKEQTQKTVAEMAELKFGKEKLAELKAQFPGRQLNIIVVEDKICVLMPLTAKALSNYTRMMVDPDGGLDEAVKQLMNELWLGGDEEIRENEEYFISAMTEIQNLIEVKKSAFSKY